MKPESSFNDGMKPLIYSKKQAEQRELGWLRAGDEIAYYPSTSTRQRIFNTILEEDGMTQLPLNSTYTLSFKIQFKYDNDEVYFAYCFPYTYSDTQKQI